MEGKKMKDRYYKIAQELKHKLSEDLSVVDMRIFGSCARGEDCYDSDIDVFIEVEQLTDQIKAKIREISWKIGLENEAVITSLIFSRNELEQSPMRSSPIVENIMREGISI